MKFWRGSKVVACEVCDAPIQESFVDGRLRSSGRWCKMCLACHRYFGIGLGIGNGQKYNYDKKMSLWIQEEEK